MSYQITDRGCPIGWVVAPEGAPQTGPGAATVLLTRTPARAETIGGRAG